MSFKTKHSNLSTMNIQVVAEESYPLNHELIKEDIEVILRRRILLAYSSAHRFSSLIKKILNETTILYRLYAKVTVPIDRATREMFEFNPVPKTRFESIIDEMD